MGLAHVPGKEGCGGGKCESHLTAAVFTLKSEVRSSAESKGEGPGSELRGEKRKTEQEA